MSCLRLICLSGMLQPFSVHWKPWMASRRCALIPSAPCFTCEMLFSAIELHLQYGWAQVIAAPPVILPMSELPLPMENYELLKSAGPWDQPQCQPPCWRNPALTCKPCQAYITCPSSGSTRSKLYCGRWSPAMRPVRTPFVSCLSQVCLAADLLPVKLIFLTCMCSCPGHFDEIRGGGYCCQFQEQRVGPRDGQSFLGNAGCLAPLGCYCRASSTCFGHHTALTSEHA